MIRYAFEVPGKPLGKARPKFTKKGHAYTPAKTVNAEVMVATTAHEAGVRPLDGAVRMEIVAVFPVAKSWTKARKAAALAGAAKLSKPDSDNIAKLVCDALNGIAYADDAQAYDVHVRKVYGPQAKTVVRIFGNEA